VTSLRYLPSLERSRVVEVTSHTRELWGEGRTHDEHAAFTLEQIDRAGPSLLRYVGLVDARGAVVASSKRFALAIRDEAGGVARGMGIGAVFVPPEHRGRGHAAKLIEAMLDEARRLGDAVAWLYSDLDPAFYVRLGFKAHPAFDRRAELTRLPKGEPLGWRVVPSGEVETVLRWVDAGEEARGATVHTPHSLAWFFWRNRVEAFALIDGTREAGVLLVSDAPPEGLAHGALWVHGWNAPGIAQERILATLRLIASARGRDAIADWSMHEGAGPWAGKPRSIAIPMVATIDASAARGDVRLRSFDHF